jgi:hypothetical protein
VAWYSVGNRGKTFLVLKDGTELPAY